MSAQTRASSSSWTPTFCCTAWFGISERSKFACIGGGAGYNVVQSSESVPPSRNVLLPLFSRLRDEGSRSLLRKVGNSLSEFSASIPIIRPLFATNRHCVTIKFNHALFVTQVYVGWVRRATYFKFIYSCPNCTPYCHNIGPVEMLLVLYRKLVLGVSYSEQNIDHL